MKVSWFADRFDKVATVGDYSFKDFVENNNPVKTLKKDAVALFSPAVFVGNERKSANVSEIHALVFDLDDLQPPDFRLVSQTMKDADCQYLIYSTFSHNPNKPKLRVMIPLTKPLCIQNPDQWKSNLWFSAVETFDIVHYVDASTKDPARMYYVPSFHPDSEDPDPDADVPSDIPWIVWQADTTSEVFNPDNLVPYSYAVEHATFADDKIADLHSAVAEYANTMKRSKSLKTREVGKRIERMLQGAQYADKGSKDMMMKGRDNATFLMAAFLAEGFPTTAPEYLAALFAESLKLMEFHDKGAPTVQDVIAKIERKQAEQKQLTRDREAAAEEARGKLIQRAFGTDRSHPYTERELEEFGPMDHRWVLQHGRDYHIFLDGTYSEPVSTMDEMQLNAERDLSPALHVNLWTTDRMGDPVEKRPREIIRQYGDVADEVVYDLTLKHSRFENRILRVAKPKPRDLEPEYHEEINTWLTLLGGEPLLNWLSVFYDLTRPLAGLYMANHKGAGKSLLAKGLVRRWGEAAQPVSPKFAFGRFNVPLLKCPFVFADEYLPKEVDTTVLREALQAGDRTVDVKHKSVIKQNGFIRLMMAANNEYLIQTREALTSMDIAAINDRFLFIDVDHKPADFLQGLVDAGQDLDKWHNQDKIAKHVLWLGENRTPVKSSRYLYGEIPPENLLGPRLALASDHTTEILEWALRILKNPDAMWASGAKVQWSDEGMSLYPETVVTTWPVYMRGRRTPSALKISQALEPVSRIGDHGTYVIPAAFLEQYNRKIGLFPPEALEAKLQKGPDNEEPADPEG